MKPWEHLSKWIKQEIAWAEWVRLAELNNVIEFAFEKEKPMNKVVDNALAMHEAAAKIVSDMEENPGMEYVDRVAHLVEDKSPGGDFTLYSIDDLEWSDESQAYMGMEYHTPDEALRAFIAEADRAQTNIREGMYSVFQVEYVDGEPESWKEIRRFEMRKVLGGYEITDVE